MMIFNPKMNLENFFTRLKHHPNFLLFLDYDGTLAPFTPNRSEAYPYAGIQEKLEKLLNIERIRVVIVSGRSLMDLRKLLALRVQPEMWGSHGLERLFPNGAYSHIELDEMKQRGLNEAKDICLAHAGPEYCEIKPYAVAFHWRGMSDASKQQMEKNIQNGWMKLRKYGFNIQPFDGGIEFRLKGQNKGNVIKKVLAEEPTAEIAYFGDDKTDEDAFAALTNRGLKVIVRPVSRSTLADIQLNAPEEVLSFFDRLIATYTGVQNG